MKKTVSILATSAAALFLALAPTLAANAATSASDTIHVSAKGGANIEYVVITNPKSASGISTRTVHTGKKHWSHAASSKAELIEVIAHQRHGSTISCSITEHAGRVLSTSTGHGKNAVAVCIVTTETAVPAGS